MPRVTFVVPGGVERESGGNVYDRAATAELARRGWDVAVVEAADETDADVVVVDSLAFHRGLPRARAKLVALAHQIPSEAAAAAVTAAEVETLTRADHVIVVSRWLEDRVRALGATSVDVVPPGWDRAWAPDGARPDATTVLCVANAVRGKGVPDVIDAVARIERPGIALAVAGDAYRDESEARAVRDAVAASRASVSLLGVVAPAALARRYGESIALATASRYEGWPIAVAEAMASGLPVIGYDIPGVAELVRHGVDGLLSPVGDVDALGRALQRMVDDPVLRTRLGGAARRRATAWPTWAETARRFADALERLLDQGSGAS